MKIKTMKSIDNNAGFIICLLLDIMEKIFKPFRKKGQILEYRNFLLIKFFGMGSIILGTPMYKAIKEKYPNSKITFLTFANNKPLLERIEFVDNVICLRTDCLRHFVLDAFGAVFKIRKNKIDVVIDMEFLAKASTIISWLSGAHVRIGFFVKQIWRADILTHKIYFNHYKHTRDIFLALITPLCIADAQTDIIPPKIYAADLQEVGEQLKINGFSFQDLIAVNINASETCLERRWPMENFVRLINYIAINEDMRFCLIGAPSESAYVGRAYDMLNSAAKQKTVDLCGKLSVGGLVALLSRIKLLITNDSGPLHIAASFGIPTVSFFGPEIPVLYGPLGKGHIVFYDGRLYCSPCLNVYNVKTAICGGNNQCIQRIKVEEVERAILTAWRKCRGSV